MTDATVVREPDSSLVTTLHITYALHAVGLAIGAFGAATVLGSFIFGWPSIIAVIINYVKRSDARGTWLESHFDWQITTFWVAVRGVDPDWPQRPGAGDRADRLCDLGGRLLRARRVGDLSDREGLAAPARSAAVACSQPPAAIRTT